MPRLNSSPRVAVFRGDWLVGSETFIRRQMDALHRYEPIGFGLGLVSSSNSKPEDIAVFSRGRLRLRRRLFGITRRSRALDDFLRARSVDVIHAHFGFDGTLIIPTANRLGIPLVVTFHGMDASLMLQEQTVRSWLYRRRLRRFFKSDAQMIAVSEHIAQQLVGFGANRDRIEVAYIGIAVKDGPVPDQSERSGVLFAGRLAEKKGVDTLLRAWGLVDPEVRATHPLTIVGRGPLGDELRRVADQLISDGSVRFADWVTPADLTTMMHAAAVFTVPSQTGSTGDTEGLPTVVLEAASRGAAIVGTVHAGTPEFVRNGIDGVLVAERDHVALATALTRLLSNEGERQRFADSAKARAISAFGIDSRTAVLESIYDRAITQQG